MTDVGLRPAAAADLDAVNAVIERAVMTWKLPERVQRLTLTIRADCRKDRFDLGLDPDRTHSMHSEAQKHDMQVTAVEFERTGVQCYKEA